MQTDRFSGVESRSQTFDAGLRAHMSSVYNRMTMGVLITAITAWLVSSSPQLMYMLLGGPQMYLIIFAPMAIIWFGFNPMTMSSKTLKLSFIGVSVLYGISFSATAYLVAGADIARAFFITSGMFAGISIFGYTTKKDLSALGTFCLMGIIGIILLSLVGLLVGFSDTVHMLISAATVVLFSGLTAWETQNTKRMYNASHGTEINSRMAWSSALSLYISFVIMFSHILSLMQER